mgnify:CR=1 FL=1
MVVDMMVPWKYLNSKGRLLIVACIINMICAITMAREGSWLSVYSVAMAAFCGLMTYSKRYQIQDADDINGTAK